MNATGILGYSTPDKFATCSNFYKGTFLGKSIFDENSYVNAMSGKLIGKERDATLSSQPNPSRVRTFQLATTSGRCFTEESTLLFIRPHVRQLGGCDWPPGRCGTGNVWATFLGPSCTVGEQSGSNKGSLSHHVSYRRGMLFHSHHSATI